MQESAAVEEPTETPRAGKSRIEAARLCWGMTSPFQPTGTPRLRRRRRRAAPGPVGASLIAAALATLAAIVVPRMPARGAALLPGPPFRAVVAGIFRSRCVKCHGPVDPQNDLRLDSYAGVVRGGESGPAVVSGDAAKSLLYLKVIHRDQPAMPPKARLTDGEVEAIHDWIEAGALP